MGQEEEARVGQNIFIFVLAYRYLPINITRMIMRLTRICAVFSAFILFLVLAAAPWGAAAQDSTNDLTGGGNYFSDWFARVTRIQSEQPHWITPMTTVTPRLEEEFRYDQSWESNNKNNEVTSYGSGKGLELIPWENIEVILGVPAWQNYNKAQQNDGFADDSFLLKYRFISANEDNGNYIVTGFLGLSVPSGKQQITEDHYIVTPTVALGKGFGDFDVQSTIGVAFPDNGTAPEGSGTPLQINTALQYRVAKVLWPEVEFNYTYWPNGEHTGKNQVFISPGFLLGRFPIWNRVGVTIGVAYQVALTDTPTFNHNFILSMRIPF
jgi:hypothetical protein